MIKILNGFMIMELRKIYKKSSHKFIKYSFQYLLNQKFKIMGFIHMILIRK